MRFGCIFAIIFTAAVPAAQAQTELPPVQPASEDGLKFFEAKIRPVLVKHCYACHSQESQTAKKLQAELFVDSRAGLLAGGESGTAIVPGKSAASLLIKALKYDGLEMPPAGKLPAETIADFEKWIDLGAADPREGSPPLKIKREINIAQGQQWWSFQPLEGSEPPAGTGGPIDRFLAAARTQAGLKANGPATKEKLIRRAYFDLIGLPPTPEQVEAFLSDDSPAAFERVVDGLLGSQHYGEKWARHWLDVARYAESGGYEFDGFRPGAYHYRDWVIRALNDDLPYDQFVRQQLAGDRLLPDDYPAAAAAGLLVAGPYPGQITAKTVERIRYDQLDDMLMTVGGSMLGLTLGCVRCHDHKYDPIPQTDYYSLAAALARTVQGTRLLDPDPAATQAAAERHRLEHEPLVVGLEKFAQDELPKRFDAWRATELPKQPDAPRWQVLEPQTVDAQRSWLKWLPEGIVAHDGALVPGTNLMQRGRRRAVKAGEEYRLTFHTNQKNVAAIRIDAFTHKSLPQRGPGLNADGSFQLADFRLTARPLDPKSTAAPLELKLKPVFAAFEDQDQPLANALDGKPATAWVVKTTAKKDNAAVFELETPLVGFVGGSELIVEMKFLDQGLGRVRISLSTEPNPTTWAGDVAPQHLGEIRALLAEGKNTIPAPLRTPLATWFSPFDAETARARSALREHAAAEPRPALQEVYTTVAGGQDVFLLRRGEVENKLGQASPGFLQVLSRTPPTSTPPTSSSATSSPPTGSPAEKAAPLPEPRVALADWMTDVEHGAGPLLARVMANRLWQHHFGAGLVGTPNDFGAQGERPSHPELLEWLATELVKHEWRLKPLHKQIMLSAAYQQSHEASPESVRIDPENRYLWHYQPRRLDAELIRDSLLAVGGNLDAKMFGSSILDDTPRRSIYLRVKRSELSPMMAIFDAPEPTQSIGERISTTVPTQALALLNSPLVRQQAAKLAARLHATPATPLASTVDLAFRVTLARLPTEAERAQMLDFIEDQRKNVAGAAGASPDPALVEFCQVLLCLNEFVYVD